jgi:2-polyprenyl-3-methyl-5-hydroxy-6-metoxy-1,4-benzoquinol methylase
MSDKVWKAVKNDLKKQTLSLGPYFSYQVLETPRHFLFSMARYKFAARMLPQQMKVSVLELGCQEGIGSLLLGEAGHKVLGVDFDADAILYAQRNIQRKNISFQEADCIGKRFGEFDAVVSLDVIEHIARSKEKKFLRTVCANLRPGGFAVIGTPNICASRYASKYSKAGHVNLFSAQRLESLLRAYFENVYIFGMNDEIVHTGFYPMSHYLMALACRPVRGGRTTGRK